MQTTLASSQITLVRPHGHLNAANAPEFGRHLTAAITSERKARVLVDMEDVESLDSAGLMVLVSALTLAQRQNQRFSLCCLSPSIRIIFELTQLDRVFEIFESRTVFEATIDLLATNLAA
ncbi:STAS domain-containing protein [Argonema galeatum]|uniref:STAS domain-containing protein n=1 Tax=Argonema galeatum TaxID=2942762 RepID=UPI00201382F7|nr:STAS domain-containing protein [Argonema galeatum]MCL1468438.1 STAS domain-containing protein [Argonema galeatum A003/A1]